MAQERVGRSWIYQCGKYGYEDRRQARRARAVTRKGIKTEKGRELGGGGLSVYRCHRCRWWHVGHLPVTIRRGEESRHEHYGRAGE